MEVPAESPALAGSLEVIEPPSHGALLATRKVVDRITATLRAVAVAP